jgi:hypothetical protein
VKLDLLYLSEVHRRAKLVVWHVEELQRVWNNLTNRPNENLPAVISKLVLTVDRCCCHSLPFNLILRDFLGDDLCSFRQCDKILIIPSFVINYIEESINQLEHWLLLAQ